MDHKKNENIQEFERSNYYTKIVKKIITKLHISVGRWEATTLATDTVKGTTLTSGLQCNLSSFHHHIESSKPHLFFFWSRLKFYMIQILRTLHTYSITFLHALAYECISPMASAVRIFLPLKTLNFLSSGYWCEKES